MSRISIRFLRFLLLLVAMVLAGINYCWAHDDDSNDSHGPPHHHHHVLADVPLKARGRTNPLQDDPEAPIAGKKLFLQHCAQCHGQDAQGSRRAPNLRAAHMQNATPGSLFWIITNGVVRHGMPVWSKLPEPQRWQIITYIKSLPSSGAQFGSMN